MCLGIFHVAEMFSKGLVPLLRLQEPGRGSGNTATGTHLPLTPVSSSSLSLRIDKTLPSITQKLGGKPAALVFSGGAAGAGLGPAVSAALRRLLPEPCVRLGARRAPVGTAPQTPPRHPSLPWCSRENPPRGLRSNGGSV